MLVRSGIRGGRGEYFIMGDRIFFVCDITELTALPLPFTASQPKQKTRARNPASYAGY